MIDKLIQGCSQLNVELSDKQLKQIEDYTTELIKWNKVINLTSIKNKNDVLIMHFLDCFSVQPYIKNHSLVDVGSGGGFPGMALSILNPNLTIYCVDTVGKKVSFLNRIKGKIKSKNVVPLHKRIEDFDEIKPNQVISRAFSSIQDFLILSKLPMFNQSEFLAMKSKRLEQEIEESVFAKNVTINRLTVPFIDAERFLVIKK